MEQYGEYLARSNWKRSEPLQNWVVRRILKSIQKICRLDLETCKVLEIGAGTGRAGEIIRDLGLSNYLGVEPTRKLADYCRNVRALNVISEALPNLISLSDDEFSLCFSIHVLEHAPTYLDARSWLDEMLRVIEPGGFCVVVAPDIRDYKDYFWDSDWSHGFPTSPRRVTQLFTDLDAEIIYEGTLHFGSTNLGFAFLSHLISIVMPTRLLDMATKKLTGRPLASGINFALFYGLTFVVAGKGD